MEWISVEDRLPEGKQVVLLLGKGNRMFTGYHDEIFLCADYMTDWLQEAEFVTHWRPLPAPPKTD